MRESVQQPLVAIRTLVYNHAPFLHDYFRGILMQKTTFPFVAIVHDDASTDGSTDIIREYAAKYPDIIKPIYETENQYSKHDGSLHRIIKEATQGIKYYATCEGDDYWTDPHKLQKQIDWLENHPECTMACCHGTISHKGKRYSTPEEYKEICNWPHPGTHDRDIPLQEFVERGGHYMLTAGLVYHAYIRDLYPKEILNYPFGDSQVRIMAALNGTVHYFADNMVTYRFCSAPHAVTAKMNQRPQHLREINWKDLPHLFFHLDHYSDGKYSDIFRPAAYLYATQLATNYPQLRQEVYQEMGYLLQYDYMAESKEFHQANLRRGLRFQIAKWLCAPYYPAKGTSAVYPSFIRFFYTAHPRIPTAFGLGKLHVISLYETEGKRHLYFCGRRIWSYNIHQAQS